MINIQEMIETNIDTAYPFLINDLMQHIEKVKKGMSNISLVDIIMDYSIKNEISVEMIGDAISSDAHFKSFIEKDCEYHNITSMETEINEEW